MFGSEKVCDNCKYNVGEYSCDIKDKEMHCYHCSADGEGGFTQFLSKRKKYPLKECKDCSFYSASITETPCKECIDYSNFNGIASPCPRIPKSADTPVAIEHFENCGCGVVIIDDVESAPSENETGSTKDSIETAINNFHTSVSPCRMCKYESDESTCKTCCYFYASEFILKDVK